MQLCRPTHVVHLAAQAGVRYAATNPLSYIDSNVRGTSVLLEAVRIQRPMPLLVYASSSSVYGHNTVVCSDPALSNCETVHTMGSVVWVVTLTYACSRMQRVKLGIFSVFPSFLSVAILCGMLTRVHSIDRSELCGPVDTQPSQIINAS